MDTEYLGDVVFRDNDVLGNGVNIASRLEATAEPGTIYISGQVYDLIQNIPEISPEYIGKRHLKNVPIPVDIYKIETFNKPHTKPDSHEDLITEICQPFVLIPLDCFDLFT